jgi:toxin-antitoxin system PIN domain toxin
MGKNLLPMTALVDANVWLPVLVERHEHHAVATAWWRERAAASCCWCRPVQQTVLRHLTNRTVMGDNTHTPAAAWLVWEKLVLDERSAFLPLEPSGLDEAWRQNIATRQSTPKLWMDAYLAAWAATAGVSFVTFDSGFKSYPLPQLELLEVK